jgi:hypothetical protein
MEKHALKEVLSEWAQNTNLMKNINTIWVFIRIKTNALLSIAELLDPK